MGGGLTMVVVTEHRLCIGGVQGNISCKAPDEDISVARAVPEKWAGELERVGWVMGVLGVMLWVGSIRTECGSALRH